MTNLHNNNNNNTPNSNSGFQSNVWGPAAWMFLHTITLNYQPSKHNASAFLRFFRDLGHVLPCSTCRTNYQDLLKNPKYRLDERTLQSRRSLSFWLFRVHNHINKKTKKSLMYPNTSDGYQRMAQFYEQFRAKCSNKPSEIGCTVPLHQKRPRLRCVLTVCPMKHTKCNSLRMVHGHGHGLHGLKTTKTKTHNKPSGQTK